MFRSLCLLLFLMPALLLGEQSLEEMLSALEITAYWDRKVYERFPVTYNHLLSCGYFTTHSARMSEEGEIGFGVAHVPPYLVWNGRIQPFCHLELSANYRIFHGFKDPALGHQGFGDFADRGANFKWALVTPEESGYRFPGIAFGIDDFMGTKRFLTYYVVGTQVFRDYGVELSFGWGAESYTRGPTRGFFGAVNWFPFWPCDNRWLRGLALTAEIDPTNYKRDPHPHRPRSRTVFNGGIKYTYGNLLELSASYVRGEVFAAAGTIHYNWGKTQGLLAKVKDPLPYAAPIDREPLGCTRPSELMIQELYFAFKEQGFQLTDARLQPREDGRYNLWLTLFNACYRQEHVARKRIQQILAALAPSNMDDIIVTIESYALPCQSYLYPRELLVSYACQAIGPFEFDLLTPRREALFAPPDARPIFHRSCDLWRFKLSPRVETFLGNAKGKVKYDTGLKAAVDGFLPFDWYYDFQVSVTAFSSANRITDFDFFHPSQLPNVATDYIRYRQSGLFTWDKLYAQKSDNWGPGLYSRFAAGYFQVNYGGIAAETLWYPAHACFAIGLEGAVVKKREYSGLGFQSKLRHFEGHRPVYRRYSTLQQAFLNLYLDFPNLCFFTKLSLGRFLARDNGLRVEATRYFNNGLRLTGWMTFTDAFDVMHGEKYYDRGIAIEVPFDFFFQRSSRRVWNYVMAAWLRDAGYTTTTGVSLFETINRERRW